MENGRLPGTSIPGISVGELSHQSLHPEWAEDWGITLRQPRNRKAILANKRLAARPAADLARRLEIPPLDQLAPADAHALKVFSADPKRFTQLVGLAAEAPRLASIIDAQTLRDLASAFPIDDIRVAISCRPLIPPGDDTGLDLDNLAITAREMGPKLVLAWANQSSAALRGRVRMMLPKSLLSLDDTPSQPGINHVAGKVVRRIAELLSPP